MSSSLVTQAHLDDKCLIQLHTPSRKKVERVHQLPNTQRLLLNKQTTSHRDEVDCLKRHLVQPD